ncbi:MAG: class I SAM-dependent methyltransferase [Planctomycetaceae bacterium]|nr:class I SAM-dependent methyltransferase [Planctomycetaceae bacterium]
MNFLTRILRRSFFSFVRRMSDGFQSQVADALLWERFRIEETLRQRAARRLGVQGLEDFIGFDGTRLSRSILEPDRPWANLPYDECETPGMLAEDEKRYYGYITKFYTGAGAAVEIGTWLGLSTYYLVTSLRKNPHFKGPLHCFDDYVWRGSSMSKWLAKTPYDAPGNHESFQPLFERFAQANGIDSSIEVHRAKLSHFEGNVSVPQFAWTGGPIELCVVDCGRTLEVNEAWYKAAVNSFLPGKTLIVMQDWQAHKAVPPLFWENTKLFTDRQLDSLELIHELPGAMAATFLYRG